MVPIKHLVHKRSTGDLIIETKINGIEKRLYLKPNKGFFASKRTKVWIARIDPKNKDKFVYTANSGVSCSSKKYNRLYYLNSIFVNLG